ncbi:MAG: transporter substrate-binding domain-containing protein [Termitinemataceae bacterium]|nr:MAG: transporter substrate-binding domain-containing protein [Termitinemataceae bacterium]
MKKNLFVFVSLVLISITVLFVSCKGKKSSDVDGLKKLTAACTQAYPPYDFVSEDGTPSGFEVDVLRSVDELLSDYEFEFVATSDDDLLIGVESGKYAVGIKGAWSTEERKAKFIIPGENISASLIGIAYRSENSNQITDFDSFAKFSGKLVPIPPQSAQFSIVDDYNKTHADFPIILVPSEVFIISDAYTWVVEGRYDAFLDIKLTYDNTVVNENGAWHVYADKLNYTPWKAIPTYPLFNKEQKDLAAKYDDAIKKLRSNGTLTKISNDYFGEDIFMLY